MATKDFVVFDGDSHVVEPPALWEKYLDPEYRTLGKHALWRQEGRTGAYLKVNGEIFRDTGNPNLSRHALWRPGMDWDAIGALDPDVKHPATEGASDPPHKTRISFGPELGTFCLSRLLPARIGQGARARLRSLGRRLKKKPPSSCSTWPAVWPHSTCRRGWDASSIAQRKMLFISRAPATGASSSLTPRWRKTDSNSPSLREGKGYGEPLQASIAVSGLNL